MTHWSRHWRLYATMVIVGLLAGAFGMIADEMSEGETAAFDNAILMLFRDPANPSQPFGPVWLQEAVRDITALGSFSILALILILVVAALALTGRRGTALFVAVSVIGGEILSSAFKAAFNRTRPDYIDPNHVLSASFPSGHAALSAVVYLTLGTILAAARDELLKAQNADGSWSQIPKRDGDAYATATVMMALRKAGVSADHAAYRRGVAYLLKTQTAEGAWLVKTRSRPVQRFFDNGDPGGKDQFISFAATGWAVQALLECVPVR